MERQAPPQPPTVKVMLASIEAYGDWRVEVVIQRLQGAHIQWHNDHKNQPSAGCHTCVLIGLRPSEQQELDKAAAQVDAAAKAVAEVKAATKRPRSRAKKE